MLKKAISTSRKLANLSSDSARLLWTWILPHLDVEGRMHADPKIIKGTIFPRIKKITPKKIKKLLNELHFHELIIIFEKNGEKYLELSKFSKFQTLRPDREAESTIPNPVDCDVLLPTHSSLTPPQVKLSKVKLSKLIEDSDRETKVSLPYILWERFKKEYKRIYEQPITHTSTERKEMKMMSYFYQRYNNWELWASHSKNQCEHCEKLITLFLNHCRDDKWLATPNNLLTKADRLQRELTKGDDGVFDPLGKPIKKEKKIPDYMKLTDEQAKAVKP